MAAWAPSIRGVSLYAAEEEPGVIEQEVFAMLDADGDGHLSFEEMAPLFGNNSSRACAVAAQMRRCRTPQAGFTPREFAAVFREDNRIVEFYQEKFHESMDTPDANTSATLSDDWLQRLGLQATLGPSSQQWRTPRKRGKVAVSGKGVRFPKSRRSIEEQQQQQAKWQTSDWSWEANALPRRWKVKPQTGGEADRDEYAETPPRQLRQRRRTAPAGASLPSQSAATWEGSDLEDTACGDEDGNGNSASLRRTWRPVFKPRRRSCLGPSEIAAEVAAEEVAAESMRHPSAHLDLAAPFVQQVTELEAKLQQSQTENASLLSVITHLRAELSAVRNAVKQPAPTREVLDAAADAAANVQQSRWRIINPTTGEEAGLGPQVAADTSETSYGSHDPKHRASEQDQRALEGGSAAETLAGLIFEPSFGSSWDWPLSRQEKKERVLMINQIQLLDELEELRSKAARCDSDSDEGSTCG